MQRTEFYTLLHNQYHDIETFSEIERTCRKVLEHFENHEKILISVSGGADSDCVVHLLCRYFPEYLHKCSFVYVDTGLEYEATKRHIDELKQRYNIEIEKIRGVSVVTACKKYGFPVLNKSKSHSIDLYIRETPKGYFLVFEANGSYYRMTDAERQLAKYAKENGFAISSKCCDVSKKKPMHDYKRKHNIDLTVTGERKAEGGTRSTVNKSCFSQRKDGDKFMPLFWWTDYIKANFISTENIKLSDCYTVYGLKRTGCVGCPFGRYTQDELNVMRKYEPQLFKACINVFGKGYALSDKFKCRKRKCLPNDIDGEFLLKGGKL